VGSVETPNCSGQGRKVGTGFDRKQEAAYIGFVDKASHSHAQANLGTNVPQSATAKVNCYFKLKIT
jgi:hypothetical protein